MICLKLSSPMHPTVEHCPGLLSAHDHKINLLGIPVSWASPGGQVYVLEIKESVSEQKIIGNWRHSKHRLPIAMTHLTPMKEALKQPIICKHAPQLAAVSTLENGIFVPSLKPATLCNCAKIGSGSVA